MELTSLFLMGLSSKPMAVFCEYQRLWLDTPATFLPGIFTMGQKIINKLAFKCEMMNLALVNTPRIYGSSSDLLSGMLYILESFR